MGENKWDDEPLANLLILLTDGEHNSGGVKTKRIAKKLLRQMSQSKRKMNVCGLAFGRGADFSLLKEISSKTGGVARMIYEDSDAALQLENFYAEIAAPILANLEIKSAARVQ